MHPNCHFTSTFYINVEPKGDLSCLELFHPAATAIDFCWMGISNSKDSLIASKIEIHPKPNSLIIFPAWLYHSVLPHGNNEPRISVTVNMEFV